MSSPVVGSSREVLGAISELFRAFPDDRVTLTRRELLDLAVLAVKVASQAQGVSARVVGEADARDAAVRSTGTPSATYLAVRTGLTGKQASGMIHQARRLAATPVAQVAVVDGSISFTHGTTVSKAVEQLPGTFTREQTSQAEVLLVEVASRGTPDEVTRAVPRIIEQLDPVNAEDLESRRLSRERDTAWQNRSLSWFTRSGSVVFTGSLPVVEGNAFTTLITAYAQQAKRAAKDTTDLAVLATTTVQRHADALIRLVEDVQHHTAAPGLAGDRPTVMVTLDFDKLKTGAARAGVLPDGNPLSAGDLRRVCCDATVIPIVLGADSEVFDVGRSTRCVPVGIRHALTLRDEHCVFPTCDTPASHCDAHHVIPWWQGGPTSLDNLVLLCPHHHGVVEPDRHSLRDQWSVTVPPGGHPVVTPPRRLVEAGAVGSDRGATTMPGDPSPPP